MSHFCVQVAAVEEPAAKAEAAPAVEEAKADEVEVWSMVKNVETYNQQLVDFIKSKGLEVPEPVLE